MDDACLILSREIVQNGLSRPEKTSIGYGLVQLELPGQKIGYLDASVLEKYEQIKYLDLSSNSLDSISALQSLPNLCAVNVQDNNISNIQSLTDLQGLQIAELDRNKIMSLAAFEHPTLEALTLCGNDLKSFKDASCCPTLRVLQVANNLIDSLEGCQAFPALQQIGLKGNKLNSLVGIEDLENLEALDLRQNHLTVASITRLGSLPKLKHLYLEGNIEINDVFPGEEELVLEVLIIVPHLKTLDERVVTAAQRSMAVSLHKEREAEALLQKAAEEEERRLAREAGGDEGDGGEGGEGDSEQEEGY